MYIATDTESVDTDECFVWFDSLRTINSLSGHKDRDPGLNQY